MKSFFRILIVTLVCFVGQFLLPFALPSADAQCGPSGCPPQNNASTFGGGFGRQASGSLFGNQGNGMMDSLLLASLMGGAFGGGAGAAGDGVGQSLALAGLLTGNEGLMLMGLLLEALGGLFGGFGGSTPQRGTAEEQAPPLATIGPQGRRAVPTPTPGVGTPSGTGAAGSGQRATCRQSVFFVEDDDSDRVLYPESISMDAEECVTFFNTGDDRVSVSIVREDEDEASVEADVRGESAHNFRFRNAGSFDVCVEKSGMELTCDASVSVRGQ